MTKVELGFHPELTKPSVTTANPAKLPSAASMHASQHITTNTVGNTTKAPHAAMEALLHLQVRCRCTDILHPYF